MNEFMLVSGIALLAAFLTVLGAPAAEYIDVPAHVISGMLQFAAGVLTALVAFSLLPPAITLGPLTAIVTAFFVGGTIFVAFEIFADRRMGQTESTAGARSLALYFGILMDVTIDGIIIGMTSALTITAGLLLALSVAVSTAPLAFVTIAAAKQQGVSERNRRILTGALFACLVAGAMLGYLLLRNQSVEIKLVLIAMASGFLLTTVTQSMIPEARREGRANSSLFYILGITLYAALALGARFV